MDIFNNNKITNYFENSKNLKTNPNLIQSIEDYFNKLYEPKTPLFEPLKDVVIKNVKRIIESIINEPNIFGGENGGNENVSGNTIAKLLWGIDSPGYRSRELRSNMYYGHYRHVSIYYAIFFF